MSGGVRRALVLASGRGAAKSVAGVPLAIRAVVALREAGFEDVGLFAPSRAQALAGALVRRGITVRWVDASYAAMAYPSEIGDVPLLLLGGDVLIDAVAAAALRDAPTGPVWAPAGQVVGVVCRPSDVATCVERPDLWECLPGLGTRLTAGLAVPLEAAGSAGRLERLLLDSLPDRFKNVSSEPVTL